MKKLLACLAASLVVAGVSSVAATTALAAGIHEHTGPGGTAERNVCSDALAPGQARCFAHERTDETARNARPTRHAGAAPVGTIGNGGAYDPPYLQSAYNAPSSSAGAGQTVAIVDAYDDPRAESDLGYYRSFFGLPACTTAGGCFRKVNQNGQQSNYPRANAGWSSEIALDLDMVSALCPSCHILLVEAADSSMVNLGTAVNEAVALGAGVVSNSYGGSEYSGENADSAAYYNHPGVDVLVASGDSGYGAEFPAASPTVTAVGGTSLNQATNTGTRNATETAWSGAGSGCSAFAAKPSWQTDTGCARRTIADVSAVADPNTGVWVYDVYGSGGWAIYGGTSVATPIVSAMDALAANPAGGSTTPAAALYGHSANLNDVVSGHNGSCSPAYLCTAAPGYDGPTGLGTPNTAAAFVVGTPAPPTAPTAPTAPLNLTARTDPSRGVDLAWSAPTSNGGATITGYRVYRSTHSGQETYLVASTCTAASCTYTDTNTKRGTVYYYEVVAVNSVGNSPYSNQASAKAN